MIQLTKKDAKCKLVIYKKIHREDTKTQILMLVGIASIKRGYIHKALENSQFEELETKIPEGYRKQRRINNDFLESWTKKYYQID
jgi:hypothetical protein